MKLRAPFEGYRIYIRTMAPNALGAVETEHDFSLIPSGPSTAECTIFPCPGDDFAICLERQDALADDVMMTCWVNGQALPPLGLRSSTKTPVHMDHCYVNIDGKLQTSYLRFGIPGKFPVPATGSIIVALKHGRLKAKYDACAATGVCDINDNAVVVRGLTKAPQKLQHSRFVPQGDPCQADCFTVFRLHLLPASTRLPPPMTAAMTGEEAENPLRIEYEPTQQALSFQLRYSPESPRKSTAYPAVPMKKTTLEERIQRLKELYDL